MDGALARELVQAVREDKHAFAHSVDQIIVLAHLHAELPLQLDHVGEHAEDGTEDQTGEQDERVHLQDGPLDARRHPNVRQQMAANQHRQHNCKQVALDVAKEAQAVEEGHEEEEVVRAEAHLRRQHAPEHDLHHLDVQEETRKEAPLDAHEIED